VLELKNLRWKAFFKSMEWPNGQRGWRPPFIVPEGNLPIGVLENRTCPMERQTSLRNLPGI
jgi:hypothetical protein